MRLGTAVALATFAVYAGAQPAPADRAGVTPAAPPGMAGDACGPPPRPVPDAASAAPAWTAPADVQAALALLESAPDEGLEPADYDVPALRALQPMQAGDPAAIARFDAALTTAMLRYLADLHCGRTRGTVTSYRPGGPGAFDAGALLMAALQRHGIAGLPVAAAPALGVYARLRSALHDYRQRASRGDTFLTQPLTRDALAAGEGTDAVAALRRRLVELGDGVLAAEEHGDAVAALRRFQRRHGLRDDGVAGPATLAALNVPLRQRAHQIALAMERLRWLPPLPERRVVAINLPSFRLWAFDRQVHATDPVLAMRVIVGRAMRTPTPVFVGFMRYVEFNPYWNVPSSIARAETLPRLARDPGYLREHHMELVQGGTATQQVTAAALQGLLAGTWRVRQRPGPDNALGPIKFGLPNPMNIYLHGTPARELFDAARRDFSHGCIRVESPAQLAGFVLGDAWDGPAVAAALRPGPTRVVTLAAPLPVVIFYATALPEADGTMTFADDIYGLDAALERRWLRGGVP